MAIAMWAFTRRYPWDTSGERGIVGPVEGTSGCLTGMTETHTRQDERSGAETKFPGKPLAEVLVKLL